MIYPHTLASSCAPGPCERVGAGDGGTSKVVTPAVHTCQRPGPASWRQGTTHFSVSLPTEGARLGCLGAFHSCLSSWNLALHLGILPAVPIHIRDMLVHVVTGTMADLSVLARVVAGNLQVPSPDNCTLTASS